MNKVTDKHFELAREALTYVDLSENATVVEDVAQALANAEQQGRNAVLEVTTTMQYPTNRGELDLPHTEHLVVSLNSFVIVSTWLTRVSKMTDREVAIKALTGLWADYFHMPYDTFDEKLEALQDGLLVKYDEKNMTKIVYQLNRQAAEDWFDVVKGGRVI